MRPSGIQSNEKYFTDKHLRIYLHLMNQLFSAKKDRILKLRRPYSIKRKMFYSWQANLGKILGSNESTGRRERPQRRRSRKRPMFGPRHIMKFYPIFKLQGTPRRVHSISQKTPVAWHVRKPSRNRSPARLKAHNKCYGRTTKIFSPKDTKKTERFSPFSAKELLKANRPAGWNFP